MHDASELIEMAKHSQNELEFDDEADELDVAEQLDPGSTAAVVSGTDWTTETIVSQLERGNIQLNPGFQRRDAWKRDRKSRFIESLIVGLPIPQIVLAESQQGRGKFIVLDGKQRLLSILQFWGLGEGPNNGFTLSGLTLRDDLSKKSFADISKDPKNETDYNSLCNQPVRTVVLRNWRDTDFLHTVFLRLNTGSVKLSPQELRQALLPGKFSEFIDIAAAKSIGLQELLGLSGPDPRMRDIEILARFLGFRFFADNYPGRMKKFLDTTFETFNSKWGEYEEKIEQALADFENGVKDLLKTFDKDLARKPGSPQFNRAIFDALIYFHSQTHVRAKLRGRQASIKKAYNDLFGVDSRFLKAVESDTAGAPNTSARLAIWASSLTLIAGEKIIPPKIQVAAESSDSKHARKIPRKAAKKK
jgi:hypothetical protein